MNAPSLPPKALARRRFAGLLALGALPGLPLLGGCAGPQLADYAAQQPVFDLRRYFDGRLLAHGLVLDRGGKLLRRLVVTLDCSWDAQGRGLLDEQFVYDDGERQQRRWRLWHLPDGGYAGSADDVVGEARGASAGPAFNWRYTLRVPVRGDVYELDFDDWMFQVDERTVLNRAVMSKLGLRVGEVLLSFSKSA